MTFEYVGTELGVFSKAINWKKYWGSRIKPYLGKTVLEVGAGIGGTTKVLYSAEYERWLGIEPDGVLVAELQRQQAQGELPTACEFREATVQDLAADELFDSIVYIDVLEHIETDAAELQAAAKHLKTGGHLIVLSPAFQYLYTEFDEAIGHYRRYTKKTLEALQPDDCRLAESFYLDAVGMLASLGNLFFLKSPEPNDRQIWLWDTFMVTVSRRLIDPIMGYRFGRSVICVWQKQ